MISCGPITVGSMEYAVSSMEHAGDRIQYGVNSMEDGGKRVLETEYSPLLTA